MKEWINMKEWQSERPNRHAIFRVNKENPELGQKIIRSGANEKCANDYIRNHFDNPEEYVYI